MELKTTELALKSLLTAKGACENYFLQARRLYMLLNPRDHLAVGTQRNRRRILNSNQVEERIATFQTDKKLRLSDIFDDVDVHKLCDELEIKFRERSFTPAVTLGLYISQALNRDEPCAKVLSRFNRERKDAGLEPTSEDASAYCKARGRLSLKLIHRLMEQTCELSRKKVLHDWKWKNRDVYLFDGLTVRAPDTDKNQKIYPQSSSQEEGLGFPLIRIALATSLATGAIMKYAIGPFNGQGNGEISLFRKITGFLKKGDIVMGDSLYDSYRDIASLWLDGIDGVFCIDGTRENPFVGECESIEEVTKVLLKPEFNPSRFTREIWESLPKTLTIRFIRFKVPNRDKPITIVTTLIDTTAYSATTVADLYGYRWDVEGDIRNPKTTLKMSELKCQTPANLEIEIAVYMLAYNLVNLLICDTAEVIEQHPREISFSSARDAWLDFADERETIDDLRWLIVSAASKLVRNRNGRNEPRAIKSRRAKYPKLSKPRPSKAKKIAIKKQLVA
jgi:hypothetical protein